MLLLQMLPHDLRRWLYAVFKRSAFRRLQELRRDPEGPYSYQPFDKTRSIFIHIPKTAGVSICRSLYGSLAGGHTTITKYQYVFSKNDFNRYFKFSFVRNPWDRLFSAYRFLMKGGYNSNDASWANEHLADFSSFEDFVTNGVAERNIRKYIHFTPQVERLSLPGSRELSIDFLGFFENIMEDFQTVAKKINKNVRLPHANQSGREKEHYLDKYTDKMIAIVEDVYRQDIKAFGYSFDNASLSTQIRLRSAGKLFSHLHD